MSDERTPEQALDDIRQARGQVASRMDSWPWWYDAGYGLAVFLMIAGAGYSTVISLACTTVGLLLIALIVRKWTNLSGVWVNAYKPRRARWVAIGLAALLIGLIALSLWLGRRGGIVWISPVLGIVGGAVALIASRIWTRVYLAETGDLG